MKIDEYLLRLRVIMRNKGKHVMNKLFDDYITGSIEKNIIPSCIICGSEENITKEHVLPKWVFESSSKYSFRTIINQLSQPFIRTTVPACQVCNSELLNSLERYIQKTLAHVDLKKRHYSQDEWENIIRWLEIIDYKFQVSDISTKFVVRKGSKFIPEFSEFSIAFIRDFFSVREVTAKCRLSQRRIAIKNKKKRCNYLIVGKTIEKTFHYFHKSGHFIYLEIPVYNKMFFYFYEKEFKSSKAAMREAKKIIKSVYGIDSV